MDNFIDNMNDALILSLKSTENEKIFDNHFEGMLDQIDGHYHSKNKNKAIISDKDFKKATKDNFDKLLLCDSFMISATHEMNEANK